MALNNLPTNGTWYFVDGGWVRWDSVNDRAIGRCPVVAGLAIGRIDHGEPEYHSVARDLGDRVEFVLPTGQRATIAGHSPRRDSTVTAITYRFCKDYSGRADGGVIQVLGYEIAEGDPLFAGCPCLDYTHAEDASA